MQSELPSDTEMEKIPLEYLSKLAEQVHAATREAATNTDFDIWEFIGIDKALQNMHDETVNNLAKLNELDKHLEKSLKKLEEIRDDATYA